MIPEGPDGEGGARFFDGDSRDRGWASGVTKREPGLSSLTSIDVVGADARLTEFLTRLDRSHLMVRHPTSGVQLYKFRWASGYVNGTAVRVQGVLESFSYQ